MDPQMPEATSEVPAPPTPKPEIKPSNVKSSLLVIMAVCLLIATVLAGLFYFQIQKLSKELSKYQTQASPIPTATPDPTADWKTYTNSYWNIFIRYPQDKLTPCPNYTTEMEGMRFFDFGFSCPDWTDVVYKIGVVGYEQGQYKELKEPTTTEQITVSNNTAIKKTYTYGETDGPLFAERESQEIVFNLKKGTLTIEQWGNNSDNKQIFNQILSTFKFLSEPGKCLQIEDLCNPQACNYDQSKCNK